MQMEFAFTIPFQDMIIIGVIVFFAFKGFTLGAVRAFFAIFRVYFSFIITLLVYKKIAPVPEATFDMPSWLAQMICFMTVFGVLALTLWIAEHMIRKRMWEPPETSNSLNKVGGIILGLLEGILIMSIITMGIEIYDVPDNARSPLEDAASYKAIKPVAPSIRDFTLGPLSHLRKTGNSSEADDVSQ